MKKLAYLSILCFSLLSCKKGDSNPVDFYYDYYPTNEGHYLIYDVLEASHDFQSTTQHDTSIYQLKIVIGDTLIDLENEIAHYFYRYTRTSSAQAWSLKDVWTTKISGNRAELVEENQRTIKLVFAPTADKLWNANAFNTFPELDCYYENLHKQQQIGLFTFDSTITVEQDNFFSLIDHRRKFEVYAKGVGLVKKVFKDHEIMNFDTLDVRKGKEIHYNLIEFGNE